VFFSFVIPVYNRPDEVKELLESFKKQSFDRDKISFEILVVEDGSTNKADEIVQQFADKFAIKYFFKENTGQGFTRNFAFERAQGDYFIILDSDCLLPPHYLQTIYDYLQHTPLDAFGGPDAAHHSFTDTQKAISYAMTSLFSTGGIRGNRRAAEKFRPRSFNMGLSRKVWQTVGGFRITRMGEDIELSIRIEKAGFRVGLIPDAFVYHKRRTNFKQFYKQLHFFGRARINVRRFYPEELKVVHCFPAAFVLFLGCVPVSFLLNEKLGIAMAFFLLIYGVLIWADALRKTKSFKIAIMALWAVMVQLTGYGVGFLTEIFKPLKK
jgi:glycosyltransferase involved in cell wall biosynthesis